MVELLDLQLNLVLSNLITVRVDTLLLIFEKIKFWSIKLLVKKQNRLKTKKIGKNTKFRSKIEILVKNRNFGQRSKFRSKIVILVGTRQFGQKSKFRLKIDI